MKNLGITHLLMQPQPKYQTLTDFQLYSKARSLLFAQMIGNRFSRYNEDLINRECKRRNYKIWQDAFSDSLISSELLRNKFDIFKSENYPAEPKITKIERLDYMEDFELGQVIDDYHENGKDIFNSESKDNNVFLQLIKYLKKRDVFICRYSCESQDAVMSEAESLILVRKTGEIASGDIVISIMNKRLTLKHYVSNEDCTYLEPMNKAVRISVLNDDINLTVWGKVEAFIGKKTDDFFFI